MVVSSKKDIARAFEDLEPVVDCGRAYGDGFDEVEEELVKVITRQDVKEHPAYGTDWGEWFDENIEELLNEAVSIVM